CRNSQTAFQQFRLLAGEWPCIGKALSSVIAGKNDDCVFCEPACVERLQHAADLPVHGFDHLLIGFLRPSIELENSSAPLLRQAVRFSFVTRTLPRPVWRTEMKTDHEWLA